MSEIQIFSRKLKSLREEMGLNQSQVAKELGLSTSALGMLETAKRAPSFEVLNKILSFYNVTYEELVLDRKPHTQESDVKYIKVLERLNELSQQNMELQQKLTMYERSEKEKAQEKAEKL
ncbi:hypothetical protein BWI97_14400 [Siphonobacter sp. BAB-5405]|uniref:helix-turn-helix domain-containing protein n=1 Tax=Siphonobacter sp. BAB-5405 TaxID=1864825 RepID=UPI000C80925A|nr:helix-turn-helix transcriptional regulator [Siphonobacter sp. BAB-5405]PMD95543.1 hypothetical protein BWI97_14400 [Siphonobacter sp. BAB-5405]